MNSCSPAQHVPTTPSLRHQGQDWWESPSAVVPVTNSDNDNIDTLAVVVPRTPQHVLPWSTPLREGRGTTTTFRTPISPATPNLTQLSRTTPLFATPFTRTMSTVTTPTSGLTPVPPSTPSQDNYCKGIRRTSHLGGEQIVPSTPKLNEAATPKTPASIPTVHTTQEDNGRRTPRVLLSPQNPSNYTYLDLFSGDDFFD